VMASHGDGPTATDGLLAAGGDPILAAKITPPGVPDWAVRRPRITKLIAEGARWSPLTVVTGPPGAGKTMALALWAAADPGTVAWLSLDEYDNRPRVFWSYVVAALHRADVEVPLAWPAGPRDQQVDNAFLLQLASALAVLERPVRLVLDDLHVLTGPGLAAGLDFVLRNVGPGLRLVVTSRMDPLLPLHRYRLAGELTEIRAADLAFSTTEAGLLLAQHGSTLPAGLIECLTRRTEGWAAGIRLAAISIGTQPDPGRFVRELMAEDSTVTGYLVEEVLNTQPPEVRDMLLSTSILERVSTEAASALAGTEQAAGTLPAMAEANAFVQALGDGWYRYHTLFAEVLRLKLRREHPGRIPALHRRAARWYERNGLLTEAVRHAAQAGDWQLAAGMVIGGLAIGEIIEPRGSRSLADGFGGMPDDEAWAEPQPHLVCAAVALSDGRPESAAAALAAADGMLDLLPADQEVPGRLAAATIRFAAARRTGDLAAVAAAAARAEVLAGGVPAEIVARHPGIRARVLGGRGVAELWSGRLADAVRVLESAVAAAAHPGSEHERASWLGHLALAEAVSGRLSRAVRLARLATMPATADGALPSAQEPSSAALAALAWAQLERNELRAAGGSLKQLDAALGICPDKLVGALACLVAARAGLAEGRAAVAGQMAARARHGWSVPPWLEQRLALVEAQACAAAGDIPAAFAAAERAGPDPSPEAAVAFARVWARAGDRHQAARALAPVLAASAEAPYQARLQAWLVDAQLSYEGGDQDRGRRSLESALRLGEREQLRLPFAMERAWLRPVLGRDPGLAHAHRRLLGAGLAPASQGTAAPLVPVMAQQLSEREREVLRRVSGMLSTAEVASELYISVNTVKTHLKSIYRKLEATHRGEAVRRARQLELI
jgi:LuxR family transcriptional regulator, maltose regulon positive regulatory protein